MENTKKIDIRRGVVKSILILRVQQTGHRMTVVRFCYQKVNRKAISVW